MPRFHRVLFASSLLSAVWSLNGCSTPPANPADLRSASPANHAELARLYAEDQADRRPSPGQTIDWTVVGPRDTARIARAKALYQEHALQTGADYYHAALLLQHGSTAEDYLLAHELCVVALSRGEGRAKWLAAATEDRFLLAIDRPQRFGTQFISEGGAPFRLDRTDEGVTDALRRALDVPPLPLGAVRSVPPLPALSAPTPPDAPVTSAPERNADLIGHWVGKAPDDAPLEFVFAPPAKVTWTIGGIALVAKYALRKATADLHEIDLFDFESEEFGGVRFAGITKIDGKQMTLEFTRSNSGKPAPGFASARPTSFSADAVSFSRVD